MKTVPEMEIGPEGFTQENFCCCLKNLFDQYSVVYLCAGLEYLTLFKQKCGFYLFDPLGKTLLNGICKNQATLFTLKSLDKLVDQIFKCLENNTDVPTDSLVTLGGITLQKQCNRTATSSRKRR